MAYKYEGISSELRNPKQRPSSSRHLDMIKSMIEKLLDVVVNQDKKLSHLEVKYKSLKDAEIGREDDSKEQDKKLHEMNTKINLLLQENLKVRSKLQALETKILPTFGHIQNESLTWKITEIFSRLAKRNEEYRISSPPLCSSKFACSVVVDVYPSRFSGSNTASAIIKCICVSIAKISMWKVATQSKTSALKYIEIKLVDQSKSGKHAIVNINTKENDNCNGDPVIYLISHSALRKGNYIVNDAIVLEICLC